MNNIPKFLLLVLVFSLLSAGFAENQTRGCTAAKDAPQDAKLFSNYSIPESYYQALKDAYEARIAQLKEENENKSVSGTFIPDSYYGAMREEEQEKLDKLRAAQQEFISHLTNLTLKDLKNMTESDRAYFYSFAKDFNFTKVTNIFESKESLYNYTKSLEPQPETCNTTVIAGAQPSKQLSWQERLSQFWTSFISKLTQKLHPTA